MARLLTAGQAAVELGVTRQTVKNRIARGELPASKLDATSGRQLFVLNEADVVRHLRERGYGATAGRPSKAGKWREDVKAS